MRKSTPVRTIAVVLAALLSSVAGAPALAAGDKYALKRTYEPGERLLLSYKIVNEKKASGKDPSEISIIASLPISLEVSHGANPGEKLVKMRFRRVLAELKGTDLRRVIDSDKPETLLPGMPLDALTKVTFQAVLDKAGKITSFTGVKEFLETSQMKQADAQENEKLQSAVEAGLKQLLEEPFIYLPDKAVAPGECWTVKRKVYGLPIMGSRSVHDEEVECKLTEVRQTKDGRVAVISIAGEAKIVEGEMPGDPKTEKKTGKIEYDIDRNMLLSHHIELQGSGTISTDDGRKMALTSRTAIDTALGKDAEKEAEAK